LVKKRKIDTGLSAFLVPLRYRCITWRLPQHYLTVTKINARFLNPKQRSQCFVVLIFKRLIQESRDYLVLINSKRNHVRFLCLDKTNIAFLWMQKSLHKCISLRKNCVLSFVLGYEIRLIIKTFIVKIALQPNNNAFFYFILRKTNWKKFNCLYS